jgi:hypothetical protein
MEMDIGIELNCEFIGDFTEYFDFPPARKSDRVITTIKINSQIYTVFIKHCDPFEILFQRILKELGILHTPCAIIEIRKQKYFMQLYSKEIPFTEIYPHFLMSKTKLSKNSILKMRKLIAAQWILCLSEMTDSKIYIKSPSKQSLQTPQVLNEFDEINPYIYDVGNFHENMLYKPKYFNKMIKKWFCGSENDFYDFVKVILRNYGVSNLKKKVKDMLSEISDNDITSNWYKAFELRIVCEKLGTKYD